MNHQIRLNCNLEQQKEEDTKVEEIIQEVKTKEQETEILYVCRLLSKPWFRGNIISTVTTLIISFLCVFPPFSLISSLSFLPACLFIYTWLETERQGLNSGKRHGAILGNGIKGEKVQKYRRGVRQQVTASGRKHSKEGLWKRDGMCGKESDTSSHVLLQTVKNIVQRPKSQTDWLKVPALCTAQAVNMEVMNKSARLAACQN